MNPKECDHTSVGMLVYDQDKLLLIERRNPPYGFAPPAGHVDDDSSFEDAARRELREEVGLDTTDITLVIEGRKKNTCKRVGGKWHYWRIYEVKTQGDVQRSLGETKQVNWYDAKQIAALSSRTKLYREQQVSDEDWQQSPGIELVWYEWFTDLGIIK